MKKNICSALVLMIALGNIVPTVALAKKENDRVIAEQDLFSKQISEKAEILLTSTQASSIQYALLDHDKIVSSGVIGKNRGPLSNQTVYGIGSVSKMFGAVAVMQLVDQGKLDLDTPVYKYVKGFKMKDLRYKRITPRMLLNHSSGLRGTESANDALFEDNDMQVHDTLLKTLSNQTLKAEPGAFSVYCNSGFTLAEILVEEVSGMSFTEFMGKNITKPLKMNFTSTPQDKIDVTKLATVYQPETHQAMPVNFCNAIASGGINSTAEDMLKFSQLFMDSSKGILSQKFIKSMENEEYKRGMWPQDLDDSSNYGLGWDSVKLYPFNKLGIKALAKGGDLSTYSASLVVLPELKMSAVVMTSGSNSGSNQLLASQMLLMALKEKGMVKNIEEKSIFKSLERLKITNEILKNAGYYASSDGQIKIQINKNGELVFSDKPDLKFSYRVDHTFMDEKNTTKLSFIKEKNGRVYLWKRTYDEVTGLGNSAMSEYIAEKIKPNPLPDETSKVWAKRDGKTFYMLNNKYDSEFYLTYPASTIDLSGGEEGYWEDRKIIDNNYAVSEVQIPGLAGRDTTEANFYRKNGIEYLEMSGYLGISEEYVKAFSLKENAVVTIGKEGLAQWYTIPSALNEKKIKIETPLKSSFAVYDNDGDCVNYSLVSKDNTVVLPENGSIVFVGEIGTVFKIKQIN